MKMVRTKTCVAGFRVMLALGAAVFWASAGSEDRAWAQTDAQIEAAKEHFQRARRLYDVGRYEEAVEEYQQAYLNVEDPAFLYNIAQAYRLAEKPDQALRFYKNYLRRAPNAPNRADVEQKIADMRVAIEEQEASATAPPPPTDSSALPPPVEPADVSGQTTPGRANNPSDSLGAPASGDALGTPGQPRSNEATSEASAEAASDNTWAYILTGVGGGLFVTGVAGALIASSKATAIEDAAAAGQPFNPDDESAGRIADVVGIVGIAGGVVAGGIGLYLLLTGEEDSGRAARNESTWSLFPAVAPGYAGAGARFGF